jgi:hypothetical protein
VRYYKRNTSTVLNAEINSSVTNEASKLSRFDVNGNPYAFLSEVNTKVSKSGDTMTGNLLVTGKVSASGGFFKESDARLKTDIKPLDYTLD